MIDRSKVIPLNDQIQVEESYARDTSHLFARLPAPFAEMKDKGKHALQPLLQSLFDNIDDALFELADRAAENAVQNMYFESMREIRIKRRGMELGFGREIDNGFLTLLVRPGEPPILSQSDVVSSETMSLVQEDELEEQVAAEGMETKAVGQFGTKLMQLTSRLDALIEHQQVTDENNPFGPRMISQAFLLVCRELDVDIKAKLVLFKLFDRYVMCHLDQMFDECNQVLISGGILPTLGNKYAARHGHAEPAKGSVAQANPTAEDSDAVFHDLQHLLHESTVPQTYNNTLAGPVTSGLAATGQAPMIPREHLLQLLKNVQISLNHQLEQQQQAAIWQGVAPAQLNIQSSISHLLNTKMPSQPMSIGKIDDDTINLIAMLFQFILDDRNLAAAMKAMIARLQIPIIKLAMLDKSFFNKGGHPARKLLNEIAQASLGWTPPSNIEKDPLYLKVSGCVEYITNEFDTDIHIFQHALTDFRAFIETELRRTQMVEQRTVTAEDGKAKSEVARNIVQDLLNERVAGQSLPKTVITLLEQGWSNVLFLICLKEGQETQAWHDALQTVDDLVWSVSTLNSDQERQRLMKLIPSMLKSLREGLSKIGYNPVEMEHLFLDLESIHTRQMRSPISKVELEAETPKEKTLDQLLEERHALAPSLEDLDAELDKQLASLTKPQPQENTVEREVVEKLVINGATDTHDQVESEITELEEDSAFYEQVDGMTMGVWVEFHQEQGQQFRARLAAVIRGTGKYIFVNRAGIKVAEYTRSSLAMALKDAQICVLEEGHLFDRALESVIDNLRELKKTS